MRILIVEDQAPTALYLRRTLERLGHNPVVATDGYEAWRIVQEENIPVVITDWVMPGLDGPQLCRLIRKEARALYTYVILLTSKHDRRDRLEGLRAGADDYLVKPPDLEELVVRLGIAERFLSLQYELEAKNRQLAELASRDGLTGLKNRRCFEDCMRSAQSALDFRNVPFSVIILDVDHFKQYNDSFGHPAGDEALKSVAWTLRLNVRENDTLARYGGEEFAILMPGTSADEAMILAERLRSTVEDTKWPARPITASFGVATSDQDSTDLAGVLEMADRALYHSKSLGRNRVTHGRSLESSAATVEEEPVMVARE